MPQSAQTWLFYVFTALSIVTVLIGVFQANRRRSLVPIYYCVGAAMTCFIEPILTRMLHATHAQIGQHVAFESLGERVPWHAAVSYTFYFGLAYLTLVPAFKQRRYTARTVWMILLAIVIVAWLYEAPIVRIGVWVYYGFQPYQPFGLQPLYWSAATAAMLIVPAALIARLEDDLHGWQKALVIPLAPIGAMGAAAGTCWPIWIALNSGAGESVKYGAATLTIAFSVLVSWLSIRLIAKPDPQVPSR
jgi:hypothetical protein